MPAWGDVQGRLGRVESEQERSRRAVSELQARTVVVEKDVAQQRTAAQETAASLETLAAEVKNMKVRIDNMPDKGVTGAAEDDGRPGCGRQPDPWADFLRRKGRAPDGARTGPKGGVTAAAESSSVERGDQLTEDEKRTLVVGGWLQDTRRSVIEEESSVVIKMEEFKDLLDSDKLAVYGPRRSVGMLKFCLREGETEASMRNRMWEVIKALSKIKYILPSTRHGGEERPMWATRTARLKSTHVSMVRRITIALAKDAAMNQAAGVNSTVNDQPGAFDCDWNLGTIWCGTLKLASASHRPPKDEEVITMAGRWVSVSAVAQTAGCSMSDAKSAFEREL